MSTPRYLCSTISTTLREYSNKDQDLIKQGFNPSNYTYLSKFPTAIKPNSLSKSIRLTSKQIIENPKRLSPKIKPQRFEWMPDNFGALNEKASEERRIRILKQSEISKQAFKTGVNRRTKNQEGFSSCPPAYISINDPFQGYSDHINRLKWAEECHKLEGDFKNAYRSNPRKQRIVQLLKHIKDKIAQDWASASFDLGLNDEDCVEIRFAEQTVAEKDGLIAYMNVLAKTDTEITDFNLARIVESWGVQQAGKLVFILRPPWGKESLRKKSRSPSYASHSSTGGFIGDLLKKAFSPKKSPKKQNKTNTS